MTFEGNREAKSFRSIEINMIVRTLGIQPYIGKITADVSQSITTSNPPGPYAICRSNSRYHDC